VTNNYGVRGEGRNQMPMTRKEIWNRFEHQKKGLLDISCLLALQGSDADREKLRAALMEITNDVKGIFQGEPMNVPRKQAVIHVLNQWLNKFDELDEDEMRKAVGQVIEELTLVRNARAFSIK
jgi:hypothetical protein